MTDVTKITVRLHPEEHQVAKELAAKRGVSIAELLKSALKPIEVNVNVTPKITIRDQEVNESTPYIEPRPLVAPLSKKFNWNDVTTYKAGRGPAKQREWRS